MERGPESLYWILPLVLMAIPAFWIAICHLISRLGGWGSLAEAYEAARPFEGPQWRWQSAALRWNSSYNNVVTVGAAPEGLYLSIFVIFRPGHAPLLIPWQEITAAGPKGTVFRTVELRFSRVPDVPVRLSQSLMSRVIEVSGSAWAIHWPELERPPGG